LCTAEGASVPAQIRQVLGDCIGQGHSTGLLELIGCAESRDSRANAGAVLLCPTREKVPERVELLHGSDVASS
jgi:hypothetical protein